MEGYLNETRNFDINGYPNRKSYLKALLKSTVSPTVRDEMLARKEKVAKYRLSTGDYRSHGKSEKPRTLKRKFRIAGKSRVETASKNLDKSISKVSNYKRGSHAKTALTVTSPLAIVPIPGTSIIPAVAAVSGATSDSIRLSRLKSKHKSIRLKLESYRKAKKSAKKLHEISVKRATK